MRTKAALRSAFNRLLLTKGYDGFSAADVAEEAGIGRSTFYEHYRGKRDILSEVLVPALTPLAECCCSGYPSAELAKAVQHFWDHRKMARALMAGQAHVVMTQQLAALIEDRLPARRGSGQNSLPAPLVAIQVAAGQLALLGEWLSGRHGCTSAQIAEALNGCL